MKVQAAMTRDVICIEATDSLADAREIMREWEIRHLPVMEDGMLIGILSDRDLLRHAGSGEVAEAMTRNPITCDAEADIGSIGQTMLDEKIDSLPVVDDEGDLVGLITSSDLIQMLVDREQLSLGRTLPFNFMVHKGVRNKGAEIRG